MTFSPMLTTLLLLPAVFCGINTSAPASLVALRYPAAATPDISSVRFILTPDNERQFEIQYFITNEEPDFLGYNLYISTVPFSLESLLAGQEENRYLERGIAPSFIHSGEPASTMPAVLQSQRIAYYRPPPVPEPFYECLIYYFRLTAYLRGGFESEASSEMRSCTESIPSNCPSASPCRP